MRKYLIFLSVFCASMFFQNFSIFAQSEPPLEWQMEMRIKHEYKHTTLHLGREAKRFFVAEPLKKEATADIGFCNGEPAFQSEKSSEITSVTEGASTNIFAEKELELEISEEVSWKINRAELRRFLEEEVAIYIDRPVSAVTISRDDHGEIVFDGHADFGEKVDIEASLGLIEHSIENGIAHVTLKVDREDPQITVLDPELQELGIQDLLSVGWSRFAGAPLPSNSPPNRQHNIRTGASKFNGVLIAQGEEFSFNKYLGPVNGYTGYLPELVIKGLETIPEYGGGLCQVSSTAYRAAMLAGFEITSRYPHSYAVIYYEPFGTDSTIYLPNPDSKFMNDSPGAVLVQTRIEDGQLMFHYYGTRDGRKVDLLGPYITNRKGVPQPITITTTDLAPGQKRVVSGVHPGLDATNYRRIEFPVASEEAIVASSEEEGGENDELMPQQPRVVWEKIFSRYGSRGFRMLVGAAE